MKLKEIENLIWTNTGISKPQATKVVEVLKAAGVVEVEELTNPELYAQAARDWLSIDHEHVFSTASGWNSEGWLAVLGLENDPMAMHRRQLWRDVFQALVILAKEEGIEL